MTEEPQEAGQAETSVVKRVMTSFVEAVADEPALKEVAMRLRKSVVEGGNLSETSLRQAMFGDGDA